MAAKSNAPGANAYKQPLRSIPAHLGGTVPRTNLIYLIKTLRQILSIEEKYRKQILFTQEKYGGQTLFIEEKYQKQFLFTQGTHRGQILFIEEK